MLAQAYKCGKVCAIACDVGATTRVASSLRRSVGVKRIVALVGALRLCSAVGGVGGFVFGDVRGTGYGARSQWRPNGGSDFDVFAGQIKWDAVSKTSCPSASQLDSPLSSTQNFDDVGSRPHQRHNSRQDCQSWWSQNFTNMTTRLDGSRAAIGDLERLFTKRRCLSRLALFKSSGEAATIADQFLAA